MPRLPPTGGDAMDMGLKFAGQRVVKPGSLPLEDLSVHALLSDAVLRPGPAAFRRGQGQDRIEGGAGQRNTPLTVHMDTRVQNLRLASLFPVVELTESLRSLMARWRSTARATRWRNGWAPAAARPACMCATALSRELLNRAALNVGSIVVGKLFGDDKEVQLRCAVLDLAVREGVATVRTGKLSTNEAIVDASGTIDMAQERLVIHIKPESLRWSSSWLRTPLYVRGGFANPDVGVEPGPLLLRAGAAIAAAVVAPAALALLPVTVPGADDDTQCAPCWRRPHNRSRRAVRASQKAAGQGNQLAEHPR